MFYVTFSVLELVREQRSMNFDKNARANVIDIDVIKELTDIKARHPELICLDYISLYDGDYELMFNEDGDHSERLINSIYPILTSMGFIDENRIVDHKKIKNGDIIRLKQLAGYRNDGLLICSIDENFHMPDPNSFTLDIYGVFRLTNRTLTLKNLDQEIDEYGSLPREFHVSDQRNSYYWSNIIQHNSIVWFKPEWIKHFKTVKYDKIEKYGLNGMFTYTSATIFNIKYTIIYILDMEAFSSEDMAVEFRLYLKKYERGRKSLTFHYYDLLSNLSGPDYEIYENVSQFNIPENEEVLFARLL